MSRQGPYYLLIESKMQYLSNFTPYQIPFYVFVGLMIGAYSLKIVLLRHLKRMAEKTRTVLDDELVETISQYPMWAFILLSFLIAFRLSPVSTAAVHVVDSLLIGCAVLGVSQILSLVLKYVASVTAEKRQRPSAKAAIDLLRRILTIVIWILGGLLILQNIGFDVTSLVAGLGIGGVAIAFALQNILGDIFSSFALVFDRPFEPGDFIIVGKHMGVVQKIGIKTTRIVALQGEEIVIPNQELTASRVQNFKKMQKRRISFDIGLSYETTTKEIKDAIKKIQKIIEAIPNTSFDRAHFKSFGDSALLIEVVYYLHSGDYTLYMDTQQRVLMELKEYLEKKHIEIAFPTQTVYMHRIET